jgi:hypothetical protein
MKRDIISWSFDRLIGFVLGGVIEKNLRAVRYK